MHQSLSQLYYHFLDTESKKVSQSIDISEIKKLIFFLKSMIKRITNFTQLSSNSSITKSQLHVVLIGILQILLMFVFIRQRHFNFPFKKLFSFHCNKIGASILFAQTLLCESFGNPSVFQLRFISFCRVVQFQPGCMLHDGAKNFMKKHLKYS